MAKSAHSPETPDRAAPLRAARPRVGHDGTDLPVGNWVDRYLPAPTRPYARLMRLDRPIGTWLLLFPCWWSLALAPGPADARLALLFVLFGLGAVIMRGAGCTWNDVTDREFDAKVARTRTRPIPSGQVSVHQALLFMVAQMLAGLAILLTFNDFAIAVGAASLVLVFIYPLMKRVTYWPQFFLGLAFNYGALLGWAAVTGGLDWPALALYVAGICWTLGYDTIYAHQDKEDDALIGVKSTALRFGRATKPWLTGFFAATVALLALTAALRGLHWIVYVALLLGALQLAWQVWDADLDDPFDCLAKFKSNRLFGWIILAGIFLAAHLPAWTS
jgi:4-hydroxybenzoate polyprenyltransferase